MAVENRVIKQYRDTNAALAALNFVLAEGQEAIISAIPNALIDGRKVGDGVTAYNDLAFSNKLRLAISTNFDVNVAPFTINGNELAIHNEAASNVDVSIGADTITMFPDGVIELRYLDGWKQLEFGGGVTVSVTYGEAISEGDPLYIASDGKAYIASNDSFEKSFVLGIAESSGALGDVRSIIKVGEIDIYTGLTVGARYYLGTNGDIVTRDSVPDTAYLVFVGVAKSATELHANIGMPEWTGRQGNGKIVGEMFKLPVYTSIPGALPFAFDNAVKKALYPELYNRVGDVFEAVHVAAGDSASASDEFYPTPIPGYYERTGLPDIEFTDADVDIANNYLMNLNTGIVNNNRRDGTKVKFEVVSGSAPGGLTSGNYYYVEFLNTAGYVRLYSTEADAISTTSIIDITSTGSGTFRLTQEGVEIGDAVIEHDHVAPRNSSTSPSTTGGTLTGFLKSTVMDQNDNTVIGGVATVTPSNETRPSTLYEFGYIQAESTLPAGEPVSALRYDTGWVAMPSANSFDQITHNLDGAFDELLITVLVKDAGTGEVAYTYDYQSTTPVTFGLKPREKLGDRNAFYLQTSAGVGVQVLSNGSIASSEQYRVVVTKPNIIATVTPVPTRSITGDYTFTGMEETINVDAATATVTLDDGLSIGTKVTIRKINSGAGTITIARSGTEVFTRASLTSVTLTSDGDFWTLEKVSSTRWELIDGVESGSNANGDFWKYWHGKAKCALGSKIQDPNIAIGGIFRSTTSIHTVPLPYTSSAYEVTVQTSGNAESHWGNARVASANTVATVIFAPISNTGRPILVFTEGEWY